jgi:interferon gamma-inducible protein 30
MWATLAAATCSGLAGAVSVSAWEDLAGAISVAGQPSGKKQKVHLEIYYESLCPYCHELLDNDFRKIWGEKDFRDRIDLELVPFGNAAVVTQDHISPGYKFWYPDAKYPVIVCQHYDGECLGNELHACANHLHGQEKMVDFVLCMVGMQAKTGAGVEKSSYQCMVDMNIDPHKMKNCVGSQENKERMMELGKRSTRSELQRKYVPWVMLDDAHVEFPDDDEKGHDLITPICGMLAKPLPKLCKEPRPSRGSKRRGH